MHPDDFMIDLTLASALVWFVVWLWLRCKRPSGLGMTFAYFAGDFAVAAIDQPIFYHFFPIHEGEPIGLFRFLWAYLWCLGQQSIWLGIMSVLMGIIALIAMLITRSHTRKELYKTLSLDGLIISAAMICLGLLLGIAMLLTALTHWK